MNSPLHLVGNFLGVQRSILIFSVIVLQLTSCLEWRTVLDKHRHETELALNSLCTLKLEVLRTLFKIMNFSSVLLYITYMKKGVCVVVEMNMFQGGFVSLEFLHTTYWLYFSLIRRKIHSGMQRWVGWKWIWVENETPYWLRQMNSKTSPVMCK